MKYPWAIIAFLFLFQHAFSQLCAFDKLRKELGNGGYNVPQNFRNSRPSSRVANKAVFSVVPLAFHFVLRRDQIQMIGGLDSIPGLLKETLYSVNCDFSAENSDSINIPTDFKKYFGSTSVRFALPQIAPSGQPTVGFEFREINDSGINFYSEYGSGTAFSSAKIAASNGLSAWDPTSYLNIWVISPMDSGKKSQYLGVTVPPSFVGTGSLIPSSELGIVISYENFLPNAYAGARTLTHELGHYFELRHIWGDDNGLCPNSGGTDDGIEDTPPQANPTFGCAVFPLFDSCARTDDGIMFMNYMDYTKGNCKHMFTKDQCAVIENNTSPAGESYGLTLHPDITDSTARTNNEWLVYPNPAKQKINIIFPQTNRDIEGIILVNTTGQKLVSQKIFAAVGYSSIDISALADGIYCLLLYNRGGTYRCTTILKH